MIKKVSKERKQNDFVVDVDRMIAILSDCPDVLCVNDAADVLHVSTQTIRAELNAGRLPGVKCGRRWLIPRNRLYAYLQGM